MQKILLRTSNANLAPKRKILRIDIKKIIKNRTCKVLQQNLTFKTKI